MDDAVIVAAGRSPITKANKGAYIFTRIDDIAAQVVKGVLRKLPELPLEKVEDVIVGCSMPEGEQGLNVARNISFLAGLPTSVGGVTVNRFCASSMEAISMAANAVRAGNGDIFIAGGIESMTHIPMGGFNPSYNEKLITPDSPQAYISMGRTAENLASRYNISRAEQDQFALDSHMKAARAIDEGFFDDEIIPIKVSKKDGSEFIVCEDECVRSDTTMEKMSSLKASFIDGGSVTAGNSSPLSDGAAFVVVMSGRLANELHIKPLARIISGGVSGVDPSIMGIGPVHAIPKALERSGLKLSDIDLIELNEAFSAQVIAVMREIRLDRDKLNVHGGSIALGHPLGCSGARIMTTLLYSLRRYNKRLGLATMCVGGGQGTASIIERL